MKILLDENVPRKFKFELPSLNVSTVREMGWSGKKNGEILTLAVMNGFNVFITGDRKLPHQQNFKKYPLTIILLRVKDSRLSTLRKLGPSVVKVLQENQAPGLIEISR